MQTLSKIGLGVVAIGVLSLSACKSKNETTNLSAFDDQAYFDALRKKKYKSKTSKRADVEALSDLLPETLDLTYGDVSYSEKSGATILSDVNLTVTDSEFGVNIETLSLWDVNEIAISDRLSGRNLDSDVLVLGRLEANNLSVFGVEGFFNPMFEASNAFNQGFVEGFTGTEISDDFSEQSLESYDMRMGSFIASDVKIHPWVLSLTQTPFNEYDDTPEANEFWHWFQKMGAWNYAMSVEDMAVYDSVYEMTMTDDGAPMSFKMNMGFLGYKGYSRGDVDYVVGRDIGYKMDMSVPFENDSNQKSIKMESSTDVVSYEKMSLSQVMKHLAIGEMPDRNNADLMSLGIWRGQGTQLTIDDQQLYSLDNYKFDMSEFHGLVPEVFEFEFENAKYNIGGIISWVENLGDDMQLSASEKAELQEGMDQVIEILERYDMTEPSFDLDFSMHWDAETGDSDFGFGLGIDDIGRFKTRFDAILPSYEAGIEILPEGLDEFEGSELETLFEDTYAFKAMYFEMRDEGFDKLLGLGIDIAKLQPDFQENPMFRNATPEQLRQMAAGGVSMGVAVAASEFPPALDYVDAITEFVTDGGTLKIDFEAKTPLSGQFLDYLVPQLEENPEIFSEHFRLDVVREK